jgi:hypothetical protein
MNMNTSIPGFNGLRSCPISATTESGNCFTGGGMVVNRGLPSSLICPGDDIASNYNVCFHPRTRFYSCTYAVENNIP